MTVDWLAGLLQAKGHCRLGSGYSIQIMSKDMELINTLVERFGGRAVGNLKDGRVKWMIYGEDAKRYMEMCLPMLVGERADRVRKVLDIV